MNEDMQPNIVKTKDETDRKCPQCSGRMDFDPKTGGLACPFCGYEESIKPDNEELPESVEEQDFDSAERKENCNWGTEKKTVLCKSCGAESIYDALDVSNTCPYCGSNQVMEANDQNTLAPGGVVPFRISDEQAAECFKKWIKRKWFCPKLAKETAKPNCFKGIYLPYWTYDTQTESTYTGEYGINRRVRTKDGEKTVTDWYNTHGHYSEFIDDQLVLATARHNTHMLQGLEPFQTAENKLYKPEYVAGFVAERYSIGLKDGWEIAKKAIQSRLHQNVSRKIRVEHNADDVRHVKLSTIYHNIKYKYLMLPIWCSNFKYNGKVYQFMVNGQTGKVSGRTPISAVKVAITIAAILLVLIIIGLLNYDS